MIPARHSDALYVHRFCLRELSIYRVRYQSLAGRYDYGVSVGGFSFTRCNVRLTAWSFSAGSVLLPVGGE